MTLEERIHESMCKMLVRMGYDAVEITGFYEYDASFSGCETCGYDEAEVHIYYNDSNNESKAYTWYGSFGRLIRNLTSED